MWHLPSCPIPIHHFSPALFIFETCLVMWLCPHDQACVLICQLKECIKTFKNTQFEIIGTYKSGKRIKLKALFRTPPLSIYRNMFVDKWHATFPIGIKSENMCPLKIAINTPAWLWLRSTKVHCIHDMAGMKAFDSICRPYKCNVVIVLMSSYCATLSSLPRVMAFYFAAISCTN